MGNSPDGSKGSTETSAAPSSPSGQRALWTAVILIISVMAGYLAGMLDHSAGSSAPEAVLTGGGAFAGAALLLIALWYFATGRGV